MRSVPPSKNDPVRSGVEIGKKDELKNILKNEQDKPVQDSKKKNDDDDWDEKSDEEEKKVPNLEKVPLITNPIDWKGFVPDKK